MVVISVDGLNPDAITRLGAAGAPTFHRLVDEGATTLNARSEVEQTITLPNHTGMVTSRRIDRTTGGHGVTWNDDRLRPRTVQAAAGHPVGSVFSSLDAAGLSSAMFAAKGKFSLFDRSWPDGIERTLIRGDNTELVKAARRDLATTLAGLHVPAHLAARRRRPRVRLDVAGVPHRRPPVRLPHRPGARDASARPPSRATTRSSW